jgi:hypothetical protein
LLIQEVVLDLDETSHEAIVMIHWVGGRHTEIRVARVRVGRYPDDRYPSPVEVLRTMGGRRPDRELAVTMNRMRCRSSDGKSWTAIRMRTLRERLGVPPFDPATAGPETITVDETARRLQICVSSVLRLIRTGALPATQAMPYAPWEIPVSALDSEPVRIGVREVVDRRPRNFRVLQDKKTLMLPGL